MNTLQSLEKVGKFMFKKADLTNPLRRWRYPKQSEINEFVAWALRNSVLIENLEMADVKKLSFLDGYLEDKRIVYLGEEDHWIHEKSDYRLLLLRYLVSRGWRYIGEELGWSDSIRVDRYLETGDESFLEQIATYGYEGALRKDRKDKPTGILKNQNGNYPVKEFKSEQLRLTRTLRDISEKVRANSDRIRFFGFDLDTLTGGGYKDIEELLCSFRQEPDIANILSLLNSVEGETIKDEMNRLTNVLEKVKLSKNNFMKLLGEKQYGLLQEHIQTLYDSLKFNLIINPAADYESVGVAMANREVVMQRHVKYILSQMKPDDKLVLMGHNRHLSKESGLIKDAGAASPGGYKGPSLGTYINHLLPGQVFSIWEIHEQGIGSQPYTELKQEYKGIAGTLIPLGHNAIIDK